MYNALNYPRTNDYWCIPEKEKTNCPSVKPLNININEDVDIKIKYLMKIVGNIEWLAYLVGDYKDDGYRVKNIIIPKQHRTSVSVSRIEFPNYPNIIGTVHSHHDMGAFFSGTDETYLINNHKVTVVVSNHGYLATIKVKAPCGGDVKMDANITVEKGNIFQQIIKPSPSEIERSIIGIENLISPSYYNNNILDYIKNILHSIKYYVMEKIHGNKTSKM